MGHKLGPPKRPLKGGIRRIWDPGDDPAWFRIYHHDYQNPTPLHRRTFGPISRFDHHQRDAAGNPREDPDQRSVIYLGRMRGSAAVEVFWDQPSNPGDPSGLHIARVCPRHQIAQLRPTGKIELLSLLDGDADDIGALPELSTGPTDTHRLAQDWAQAVYEDLNLCGIWYPGAHNLGECIVLWDNSPALEVVVDSGRDRDESLHTLGVWEPMVEEYSTRMRSMVQIAPDECPRCRGLGLR